MIKQQAVKDGSLVKVTFVLPEDHESLPASVVGDFNGWDPLAHPLKRRSNRTCSASVELEPGRNYRFRYLGDGGRWFDELDVEWVHNPSSGVTEGLIRT
jgi:hypothetical protein